MATVRFDPAHRLRGDLRPPADKSISHRSAMLGAMSATPVRVRNYLEADDTISTLNAVRALGARVDGTGGELTVHGVGPAGARQPERTIDVGNAGTLMRLLPGWLASQEGRTFTLDGDASIRRRPVDRIATPLGRMGARIEARDGRLPPFTVRGAPLHAITYELPVASAQIKSAVALAALAAEGETAIVEPAPSRDHTERMLAAAGVRVRRDGARVVIAGGAGTLAPGSGFVRIAQRMGGRIDGELEDDPGATIPEREPVSDLEVAASPLRGTVVEPEEVPRAIDELPLVALLGCFADGETVVRGAQELRVKESDRIATVVDGLRGLGADIEATEDGFVVRGTGGLRGGTIASHGDHRLAMLGAVAGLASRDGVEVVGMEAASVSYPTFEADIAGLL